MKALRRTFLCSNFKEYATLAKAFSFCLAFMHKDLIGGSNVNYQNGYPEAFHIYYWR